MFFDDWNEGVGGNPWSGGVDRSVGMTFSEEMEEGENQEDCTSPQLNREVNCRCFSGTFRQPSQGELHVRSSY